MNEEPWERPVCFLCDYGWIIGIVLLLMLVLYFTRTSWMPLVGL